MTNREHANEIELQDVPLTQRRRTRGLLSQISAVLLQPVYFFRTLPHLSETRQWLWAGLLILFLIGFSAVRYNVVTQTSASDAGGGGQTPPIDFGQGELEGDGGGLIQGGDFGGGIDFGGIPDDPSLGGGGEVTTGEQADVSETLTIGFIAASEIVINWLIISVLLIVVSLLRGRLPRFGHNFQIAIWATLPLALMALLQVLFYAAGGTGGQPGLAGLLVEWEFYQQQNPMAQDLMYSLAIRLTIFWLWTLALLYFGARNALHGPRIGALFIALFWAVIVVVVPVVTGAVAAPQPEEETPVDEFPGGEMFPPGIEIPGSEFPGGEFPGEFATEEFGIVGTDEPGEFGEPVTGEIIGTDESVPSDFGNSGENTASTEIRSAEDSQIITDVTAQAPANAGKGNVRPVVPPVEGSVEVEPRP
jgi:hypothetical protein